MSRWNEPRITPEKRRELNRWANLLRTQAERDYAFRVLNFHDWSEHNRPERGRVTIKRAAELEAEILSHELWEGIHGR